MIKVLEREVNRSLPPLLHGVVLKRGQLYLSLTSPHVNSYQLVLYNKNTLNEVFI